MSDDAPDSDADADGQIDADPHRTLLVVDADGEAATVRDVDSGQVHALAAHPDLETGEVVRGDLVAAGELGVAFRLETVAERHTIPVERADLEPTARSRELAADQDVGEITRTERAGEGEVHVLTVPPAETEAAVTDVVDDAETVARAARLDVDRVEVRSSEGVVSVRYLPD